MNFDFYSLPPEDQAKCLILLRQSEHLNSNDNDESKLEALLKLVSAARSVNPNQHTAKF